MLRLLTAASWSGRAARGECDQYISKCSPQCKYDYQIVESIYIMYATAYESHILFIQSTGILVIHYGIQDHCQFSSRLHLKELILTT